MAVRYWNITHQNSSPEFLDLFDHSVIIHLKVSIRHQHKRGHPFNNTYRVLWRGDTGFVLRLTQNCSQLQVAIWGTADFPLPPCFLILFQPGRLLIELPGSHFISHFFLIPRYKTLIHTVEMYISLPLSLPYCLLLSLSLFPPLPLSVCLWCLRFEVRGAEEEVSPPAPPVRRAVTLHLLPLLLSTPLC